MEEQRANEKAPSDVNDMHDMQQERGSAGARREDRRVFAWGIVAAVVALLAAGAYFHVLQKRFEVPVELPATPTAPLPPGEQAPGAPRSR
ncbi:hypothetical protein [Variovorax atrisoli]|uniref:hypothetical protein n=1 Tax=Variovorax atrisoli TaxID=3394203 RepID=UPI000365EEE0|nr:MULTISPECIES: hypothetical protein [Variovorax]MBB3641432.1 cell division protein FtsN [Variovorax sp. BK613]MDR6524467.1 cell division protein FtsN [Variovorax paradoxus]RTD94624.1 hypothetical protein EJO68_12750 [Variovorax sp. 369]